LRPGCTVLIAGSRQGLGRALAEHYARHGHTVFGLSRGDSDFIHEHYHHILTDVTEETLVQRAFESISAFGGSLDVVIYSAGMKSNNYALLTTPTQAEDMIRTNLLGAFLVTRHAIKLMKRHRFGRFIYLSSIAVPLGSPGSVVYGASKAGLEQMAFALSREFPQDNITFNTLGISIFPSPMVEALSEKVLDDTRVALVKRETLELGEVVGAVDFFASDAARQITGQTIYFGGVR
jgi:3-oxoacyl-[acyl-carrier protein] reductase